MVHSNLHDTGQPVYSGINNPRIESKLESTNNKLLYLIKKVDQLSKAQNGTTGGPIPHERLKQIAEKLRKVGLGIEYTDGRGIIKLKAFDQRGIDNLRRLNTVFTISMVESFIENVIS